MNFNILKKHNILCKLPSQFYGYDFRTIEEYFDLNKVDENQAEPELIEAMLCYYCSKNWQWHGILERPMHGHICNVFMINKQVRLEKCKLFIEKIKKFFNQELVNCFYNDYNCHVSIFLKNAFFVKNNELVLSECSENFLDLIEKYLYKINYIKSFDVIQIDLEPVYTYCLNDRFIENKLVYTVVSEKEIEDLLNKPYNCFWLRPNVKRVKKINDGYRYFPEKRFYIGRCDTLRETVENIQKYIKYKQFQQYAIVEIDTLGKTFYYDKFGIDFWDEWNIRDIKNISYSYTAIPQEFISNVFYNVNEMV